MKLNRNIATGRRAFTLVELLTYLTVVGLVMSLTVTTVFQLIRQTRDLRRNCEDIAQTAQTGERWREDIRASLAPPTTEAGTDSPSFRIPTGTGDVVYSLIDGILWRKSAEKTDPEPVLRRVKSSELTSETRGGVTGWRWEIELQTRHEGGPVKPLFSFIAVAGHNRKK